MSQLEWREIRRADLPGSELFSSPVFGCALSESNFDEFGTIRPKIEGFMHRADLRPLEMILERRSEDRTSLPYFDEHLYDRYIGILDNLRRMIYPSIDVGLATLSQESGLYTLHGSDHFDEVVRYAGNLLGCRTGDEGCDLLSVYELYVLLVAIRIHDAGNMYGREGHERKAFRILSEMGDLSGADAFEKRFIADVAQAHGGRLPDGSKDTISQLSERVSYGSAQIRPRLLAAIVRFADEICESAPRAALKLLDSGAVPKHNEVFHKYASCIKSVFVKPDEKRISLRFALSVGDVLRKWGKAAGIGSVEEVYLMDEILARLDKMVLERQYCTRFMSDTCNFEHIDAGIEIYDDNYEPVEEVSIIGEAEDYPSCISPLKDRYREYTGEKLYRRISEQGHPHD
jgi:hypothetical protein